MMSRRAHQTETTISLLRFVCDIHSRASRAGRMFEDVAMSWCVPIEIESRLTNPLEVLARMRAQKRRRIDQTWFTPLPLWMPLL